jgi:hypothetical protein
LVVTELFRVRIQKPIDLEGVLFVYVHTGLPLFGGEGPCPCAGAAGIPPCCPPVHWVQVASIPWLGPWGRAPDWSSNDRGLTAGEGAGAPLRSVALSLCPDGARAGGVDRGASGRAAGRTPCKAPAGSSPRAAGSLRHSGPFLGRRAQHTAHRRSAAPRARLSPLLSALRKGDSKV